MWAKDGIKVSAFPKEPVMGGQLSLHVGDPHVPLLASLSTSGKDVIPKCQLQAGGLSQEAAFQDVSQTAELLLWEERSQGKRCPSRPNPASTA